MHTSDKEVVIITGSAGRIGSALAAKLGEKYNVVGFELLHAIYASKNEELVPVDISSDESVAQAFRHIRSFYGNKIAAVVHLAAYYSFSDRSMKKYEKITVKGTERLLKALQSFEVEQFLFSSTMLVHAPCKPNETIDENWLVKPEWPYPQSKVLTEKVIHEQRGKIPSVVMRISGVYDDDCHSIPISQQITRIYEGQITAGLYPGNKTHGQSFMHMDDLVNAIYQAVEKRKKLPRETVLEMGSPKTLSYDYLQKAISKHLTGKEIKTYRIPKFLAKIGAWFLTLLPGPKFIQPWMIDLADENYNLNVDKAKKLLSWEPKHTLDKDLPVMLNKMIKDPLAWYRKNGLTPPKHMKTIIKRQQKMKKKNGNRKAA